MKGYSYRKTKVKVRVVKKRRAKAHVSAAPVVTQTKFNMFGYMARGVFAFAMIVLVVLGSSGLAILTAAFEAHVINVTAKIENRACNPLAGFETDAAGNPIAPGQIIDDEFAQWGLTISAVNNTARHPDLAIAFDTANPSGGDVDLGTPNEDFGGPGVGVGGEEDAQGENVLSQGNVLIIAENDNDQNNDSYVDTPDDEGRGGLLRFDFAGVATINTLRVLDIDEGEDSYVQLYGTSGLISEIKIPDLGNNSAQTIQVNIPEVKTMLVSLSASGAVDDLCFSHEPPEEEGPQCNALSIGYWTNHEGCKKGEGSSDWENEIQTFSQGYSGYFESISGGEICEALWVPNCPGGNSNEAKLCKATVHILADELNVVSGHLDVNAVLAGADDGDDAFGALGLDENSTVQEALSVLETVLASGDSDNYVHARHVAERIYTFYETENSEAPQCVYEPADETPTVPEDEEHEEDTTITNENSAIIINEVEVDAETGENNAEGDESDIDTGDADSETEIENKANINKTKAEESCTDCVEQEEGAENNAEKQSIESEEPEEIVIEEPPDEPVIVEKSTEETVEAEASDANDT